MESDESADHDGPPAATDLVEMVSEGSRAHATLEHVAELIGCSPRTVQRRLKNTYTTYKTLVEQARLRKALQRVSKSDDRFTAIAMDLNYDHSSSFTRAFRRWTGMSPSEFRKLSRNGPSF